MPTLKIYAPLSAKEITTQYGPMIKLSGKAVEVAAWIKQNANRDGYINMDVAPRRERGQYGQTHSVFLNQWQPDRSQQPAQQQAEQAPAAESDDNIPM